MKSSELRIGNGTRINQPDGQTDNSTESDDASISAEFVWLDGELVPFAEANVHFLSPTLHYGVGVFEGIRCYATDRGPAVFRLREHLNRFVDSIRVLGVDDLPHDYVSLRDAVCRLIFANNLTECYIRPLLYFEGSMGLNFDSFHPVVGIAAWQWDTFLGQHALEVGARLMVSSMTRMHPTAGLNKAKFSGPYLNSIIAKTMANRAGFDEAIMLDTDGFVNGCTGENLLLVSNNIIYSPPKANILEGVTRNTAITLARDSGYEVVEETITRDQLYLADEILLCGTAAEVVGVREIDSRPIGNGQVGPITRYLQQRYFDVVRGRDNQYLEWLDFMVIEPVI